MASTVISRFLPPDTGSPSIYETLRQEDESSDHSDVEQRAGMAIDEENLREEFRDSELGDTVADTAASLQRFSSRTESKATRKLAKPDPQYPLPSSNMADTAEEDDEVPPSLLIEDNEGPVSPFRDQLPGPSFPPTPGPASKATKAKWRKAQEQQRLHTEAPRSRDEFTKQARAIPGLAIASPRERAIWRWANVEDLDNFLRDVYEYFLGNGIWCILLSRLLNLL